MQSGSREETPSLQRSTPESEGLEGTILSKHGQGLGVHHITLMKFVKAVVVPNTDFCCRGLIDKVMWRALKMTSRRLRTYHQV